MIGDEVDIRRGCDEFRADIHIDTDGERVRLHRFVGRSPREQLSSKFDRGFLDALLYSGLVDLAKFARELANSIEIDCLRHESRIVV